MKTDGDKRTRNIILTGYMGTGKSKVGPILAGRLGWPFVDTDVLVEKRAGRAVADIFKEDSEEAFRRLEQAACLEAAAGRRQVISTGGGALLFPRNRAVLTVDNLLVCLTCDPEEIARRVEGDPARPLLAGLTGSELLARIKEFLAPRQAIYDALPHHIDTTHRTPEEVADEVLALWHQQT